MIPKVTFAKNVAIRSESLYFFRKPILSSPAEISLLKPLPLAVAFALTSAPLFAETLLEQRMKVIGNQVGGFFAEDPVAHAETSLEDSRKLKAALVERKIVEIETLRIELREIDVQLARLNPDYVPAPVSGLEARATGTAGVGIQADMKPLVAPGPITTCVLGTPGCE